MKKTTFQTFVMTLVLTLSISLVISLDSAFAEKTKLQTDNCKTIYSIYKEIGESKFKEKYKKKSSLLDCAKLYKNPSWTFSGKGKIDQYHDSLKSSIKTSVNSDVKINLLSKNSIGQKKFVLKFEACSKQTIQKPHFLIKSDAEKYLVFSETTLQNNKCSTFRSEINTASPSTIQIEYIKEPNKYENLKTKRLSLV